MTGTDRMVPLPDSFELYRRMYTVRRFEERALDLFASAEINGTVHTCIGEESCSVGVVSALDPTRDIVVSNHRGHGHFITFTDDVEGLLFELMGREDGVCGGIGGSQHLHRGNFYSNGIQGGIAPVALGMALAERSRGSGGVVAVFLGDGTMGQGAVYESLNLASLWGLPVLFVITNNFYAQTTPTSLAHAGDLRARPEAFGITGASPDGSDVTKVMSSTRDVVASMRMSSQPRYLYLETYRLAPHSKGDDTRDPEEVAAFRKKDPLPIFGQSIPQKPRQEIERAVEDRLANALERARALPAGDFAEYRRRSVETGVYVQ